MTSYEPAAADLEDVGLAAAVALEIDDAPAELAAETTDASEELKEDMEADAAAVEDDRAALFVLRVLNEALDVDRRRIVGDLRGSSRNRLTDAHDCGYLS